MAIPKEPRQMMINMMYLVLTALLALNVSAEILNAFKIVDKGISKAKDAIKTKNAITYSQLKKQSELNPGKAKEAFDNAQKAKALANALDAEIEKYKNRLVEESGGVFPDGPHKGELMNDKDLEAGPRVFIEEEEGKNGKDLMNKINNTRKKLYALIPASRRQKGKELEMRSALRAEDFKDPDHSPEENKWYFGNFHMVPVVACLAILNGIQQNIKTAEADVINECLMSIGADDFKFDTLVARVVPENTIITEGGQFKAHIFLSAFDSKADPDIFVGGNPVKVDGGEGLYTASASGEGEKKYAGDIRVKDPNGRVKSYKFDGSYQVIKPFASVSPEKMNVFYMGVENPIRITAAGFTADKIAVTISQGTIAGSAGKYVVTQNKLGSAIVSVSGTTISGKEKRTVKIGDFPFRVKMIPSPYATIANLQGGAISADLLKIQKGISAVLDNFDFDYKYAVTKFTVYYRPRRGDPAPPVVVNGNMFNDQVRALLNQAKPGDSFFFEDITVQGPGNPPRKIGAISFRLN